MLRLKDIVSNGEKKFLEMNEKLLILDFLSIPTEIFSHETFSFDPFYDLEMEKSFQTSRNERIGFLFLLCLLRQLIHVFCVKWAVEAEDRANLESPLKSNFIFSSFERKWNEVVWSG